MLCLSLAEINLTALGFFILFALIFIALVVMYIYSLKLKRKTRLSAGKFSADIKTVMDRMPDTDSKLTFLKQTEHRVKNEKSYEKNPGGRDLLLSKIYQHKAAVLFLANRIEETIEACSEILSVEPSHVQTYLNRGSLYSETGRYEKAIQDFNQAELLDSRNANIYNNRGWIYLQMKQYDKALSDFDYAISINPSDIEYFNRANACRELGKWEEALSDYEASQALNNQPTSELHGLAGNAIREVKEKLNSIKQNNS